MALNSLFQKIGGIGGNGSNVEQTCEWVEVRTITNVNVNGEAVTRRQKLKLLIGEQGATIHGDKYNPVNDGNGILKKDHIFIDDPRAANVDLGYNDKKLVCLPSQEKFSAHSGLCEIIGSKLVPTRSHRLQLGDIIRFGSVGVVVSEINTKGLGSGDGSLSPKQLEEIRTALSNSEHDTLGEETDDDDEEEYDNENDREGKEMRSGVCYICYEDGDKDNPLVAPCKCSGDTKYIHVRCLKRWNRDEAKNEVCVLLDSTNQRSCSVCKTPYPAKAKTSTGEVVSLMPADLKPPSITFVVLTSHGSSPIINNSQYKISFKRISRHKIGTRAVTIGRSSLCDMVLKHRTVSTAHSEIDYNMGEFTIRDLCSSNGTLKYISSMITLEPGKVLNLKYGKSVLSLQAKKRARFSNILNIFGGKVQPKQ